MMCSVQEIRLKINVLNLEQAVFIATCWQPPTDRLIDLVEAAPTSAEKRLEWQLGGRKEKWLFTFGQRNESDGHGSHSVVNWRLKYRSSKRAFSPPIANAFVDFFNWFSRYRQVAAARRKCVGFVGRVPFIVAPGWNRQVTSVCQHRNRRLSAHAIVPGTKRWYFDTTNWTTPATKNWGRTKGNRWLDRR